MGIIPWKQICLSFYFLNCLVFALVRGHWWLIIRSFITAFYHGITFTKLVHDWKMQLITYWIFCVLSTWEGCKDKICWIIFKRQRFDIRYFYHALRLNSLSRNKLLSIVAFLFDDNIREDFNFFITWENFWVRVGHVSKVGEVVT